MNYENELLLKKIEELSRFVEDRSKDDVLRLNANVTYILRDADGNIKDTRQVKNIICTAGKNKILAATSAEAPSAFSYVAIGTSATAVAITDTTLGAEVARVNSTVSNPTAPVLQFAATFNAGTGTGAITESGLLDAASVGLLLAHQTFSVINKGASDSLTVNWQLS